MIVFTLDKSSAYADFKGVASFKKCNEENHEEFEKIANKLLKLYECSFEIISKMKMNWKSLPDHIISCLPNHFNTEGDNYFIKKNSKDEGNAINKMIKDNDEEFKKYINSLDKILND